MKKICAAFVEFTLLLFLFALLSNNQQVTVECYQDAIFEANDALLQATNSEDSTDIIAAIDDKMLSQPTLSKFTKEYLFNFEYLHRKAASNNCTGQSVALWNINQFLHGIDFTWDKLFGSKEHAKLQLVRLTRRQLEAYEQSCNKALKELCTSFEAINIDERISTLTNVFKSPHLASLRSSRPDLLRFSRSLSEYRAALKGKDQEKERCDRVMAVIDKLPRRHGSLLATYTNDLMVPCTDLAQLDETAKIRKAVQLVEAASSPTEFLKILEPDDKCFDRMQAMMACRMLAQWQQTNGLACIRNPVAALKL